MKPETVGRVLGIGLRVAGRVARNRMNSGVAESSAGRESVAAGPLQQGPISRAQGKTKPAGSVVGGVGGFLRPFRRVAGALWLEVTGVFFLLPVVAFAPTLWRTRLSFAHGPDHRTFVASAVVVVVFLYLGVTSFWRARRRPHASSSK
jgi:hypothetical protein